MALKRKLTKEEFDKLPPHLQAEYKPNDDKTEYVLEVEGEQTEDVGALKRAKDRETEKAKKEAERAKKAEEERDALQAQLNDDSTVAARKRGDIAALEKSWKEQQEAAVSAERKKLEARDAFIIRQLGDNVANTIATNISQKPGILLPHIRSRIQVEFEGDEPKTRILDKDGKPSALTAEDLQKEFVANPDFAGIITASKASGSGASGGNGGGGASKKLAEMNDKERTEWYKRDPSGFNAAVAADMEAAATAAT